MKSSSTTTEDTLSKISSYYDVAVGEPHQQHLVVLDALLKKQDTSSIISTDEFQLRAQDICCGRGRGYWKHPGNKRFHHLIQANAHLYSKCPMKDENSRLITSLVERILNNGATRFVKEDKRNAGRWIELDETSSREKTRHAIRDYSLYKSKKQTEKEPSTKKKKKFKKKTAMNKICVLKRLHEIHQKPPTTSAAEDGSYSRTSSAFMEFHQARMRAPALLEPGCPPPAFTTYIRSGSSSIHPPPTIIPLKLKEGRYRTDSLEGSHTPLSREEILEVCDLLMHEQDDETGRSNDRVAAVSPGGMVICENEGPIFPSDWL
jgi:hypothetical protein